MKLQNFHAAIFCAAALSTSITSLAAATEESNPLEITIVTGTRFSQPLKQAPTGFSVITASDIENSAAKTLSALLAQHAGIQVRSSDGTADMAIDMRGFGMSGNQNTLVLLDGQQLNDIELTSIRWSAIPLALIERIEIINGGGAVLYGGGATGGTINIITKHPSKGKRGDVSLGVGSYNTKEWQLGLAGAGERVGLRVTASGLNSSNYRANNDIEQNNLEADVRSDVGQGEAILKLGADKQNLRYPGSRSVNPTTGVNELETDPRGTSTPLDYGKREGAHASLGTRQQLDFGQLAGEISYRNKKQQAYLGGSYLDTQLDLLAFSPRVGIPYRLGGFNSEVIVGVDIAEWDYDSRRSNSPASIGTPATHIVAEQSHRALYAQSTTELDADTKLTLGARTHQVDYQATDTANNASYASGKQKRNVKAYELGLRQNLNQELALFGRIGSSFRIATVDEIFNQYGGPSFDSKITLLEPQTSQDGDVGVDYKSAYNKVRAALFQTNLKNEIHYNAITFANMNLSPTRRYGLELVGSHSYSDALAVNASYSYTVAKFREGSYGGVDVSGNNIPLVPRQRLTLSSFWKITDKTSVSGNLNYVGKQHFDNDQANTFGQKMPAYTTVDVKFSRREGAWLLGAAVNNLFNKKYYTYGIASNFTPGKYNAYPMPERSLSLKATYEF